MHILSQLNHVSINHCKVFLRIARGKVSQVDRRPYGQSLWRSALVQQRRFGEPNLVTNISPQVIVHGDGMIVARDLCLMRPG